MLISKDPQSSKTNQNSLDAPAPEAPVQAKSMTPPPFQLQASSEGMEEMESESVGLESGHDAVQMKGAADAGAPAEGGSNGGSSGGGSGDGLPSDLKSNMEQMSGQDLSDVKVHMNSDKPKDVGALAYAQGTDIHVAPGQEKHLPHEAWHTVQQKQGNVQANTSVGGMGVNNDPGLESEADRMGEKAMQMKAEPTGETSLAKSTASGPIQRVEDGGNTGPELETAGGDKESTPAVDVVVPGKIDIRAGAEAVWSHIRTAIGNALGVAVDALETMVYSVNLKFHFELGIEAELLKGLFGVGGSGVFEASATLNQQDDRLTRAAWTLSYGGKLATQWFWIIETESTWLQSFSRTSVYRDMSHFIGNMYEKISEFVAKLRKKTSEVEALPEDTWNGEGRNWDALRHEAPTDIHSSGSSQEHSVGVGGVLTESGDAPVSASVGSSQTDMHFYRGEGEDRQVRNATQNTKSISGAIKIGPLDASLTFTETNIANHANEDNDGRYHNYNLTLNNPPYVHEFFEALGTRLNNMTSAIAAAVAPIGSAAGAAASFAHLPQLFGAVKGLFSQAIASAMGRIPADKLAIWQSRVTETSSSFSSSMNIELNYVEFKDDNFQDFALQYIRISAGRGFSASFDTEIPLATFYGVIDVNATTGGSFNASANAGVVEIAGTNTLTYFITVYNGLVYSQAQVDKGLATDRFGRWNAYKGMHYLEIGQLIKNLGDPQSIAYREAVSAHGLDPNSGLLATAKGIRDSGSVLVNSQARSELDAFFEQNYIRRAQYAGTVAADSEDFQNQAENNSGRTPWAHVAGGSSKVFIDIANSTTPQVLRSDYSPTNQTPSKPDTIIDCLMQDQVVDTHLTIKYKKFSRVNEGSMFNPNYVNYNRAIHQKDFTFPQSTDRPNAIRILVEKFMQLWGTNPEAIPEELFAQWFSGYGLEPILAEYRDAKSSNDYGGGHTGRNLKNRALADIRTRFYRGANPAMTALAEGALSSAKIRDANASDTYQTGMVFKDDHLNVTNRDGLRPGVGQGG